MTFYARLRTRCDTLPEPVTPHRITFPGEFVLRMSYHRIVLLAQPFCRNGHHGSTLLLATKGVHEQEQNYFVTKALLVTLRARMPAHEKRTTTGASCAGRCATSRATCCRALRAMRMIRSCTGCGVCWGRSWIWKKKRGVWRRMEGTWKG
ncbi:hypothetical protein N657DRAFT_162910 [Parathielavia appendiculata]|uniref:Uncharacterized protein n=1 Tax=Parathielavia appendiculata TaxID=2587402 RepID=A0AAN6TU57_9PEZI|nr:hypothetical protein N657DRAFT_162910 [Parathielavia appendiculata]